VRVGGFDLEETNMILFDTYVGLFIIFEQISWDIAMHEIDPYV